MRSMAIQDMQLLIVAEESSKGGRGGLFERFIAKLLASEYGFENPTTQTVNVTSEGIELDIVAKHKLTGSTAVAECKAYTRPVSSSELTNFYGKLTVERFDQPQAFGLLCALPRLTADGQEKANAIAARDQNFKYLSANDLAGALRQAGLITDPPSSVGDASDHAILVTERGIFGACIALDGTYRTPTHVALWAPAGSYVPPDITELAAGTDYANGLPVQPLGSDEREPAATQDRTPDAVLLTSVAGSSSDFEYQLPASPKYFVGRSAAVRRLEAVLATDHGAVVVLNAQSGWGKSSLALKMGDLAARLNGVATVLDTRTADAQRYVSEVLRKAGTEAASTGILTLPDNASWASLESALATMRTATWHDRSRPILAFFDQFENVFRDVALTRTFRDLALGVRDVPGPLVVGFAWKTDLVGWTEGHPFQLRDDIRSAGTVVVVPPFGAREVDTILNRVAKQAAVRLLPDLRSRLRAYSQGLPWLLKKLADHVLRELQDGETQEGLLAESLNVGALFEADLAELSPSEQTVLRHVARFAPIAAVEVTERFGPESVQSLVDRRLVVQVGDRLDTYWDTFRDFLNTGSVPVQESWILRQTPRGVARLLPLVVEAGGNAAVQDLVEQLNSSDKAIFNLSRELRLLGVTAYEPNRVRLVDEVWSADDREAEMRRRVGFALRRHRAFTALRNLAERSGGQVTLDSYGRELPNAFPAVEVSSTSWTSYARAFLFWMEYAGLVLRRGSEYRPTNEPAAMPTLRLLDNPSPLKYRPSVPYIAPGRAVKLLARLHRESTIELPTTAKDREAAGTLSALGAVAVTPEGIMQFADPALVRVDGTIDPIVLLKYLESVPGGVEGLNVIRADARALPQTVGDAIRAAAHATWTAETTRGIGGHFRSWAKLAGVRVEYPRRVAPSTDPQLPFDDQML